MKRPRGSQCLRARKELCLHQSDDAGAEQFSVGQCEGRAGVRLNRGVRSPVRRREVHAAITVEIPRCHALPKARPLIQSPIRGCVDEPALPVGEHPDGSPFAGHHPFRPAIVVQITPDHAVWDRSWRQGNAQGGILPPSAVAPSINAGCVRVRIASWFRVADDGQLEVSISVHIGQCQGARAFGAPTGCDVCRACVGRQGPGAQTFRIRVFIPTEPKQQ
jgi:hypothetical protein